MNVAILIKSCQKYADRRKACRDTWLKNLERVQVTAKCKQVDYVFVIADPSRGNYQCAEENSLVLDGVSDSFQDIAPKVSCGLRYVLDEGADYVFVCDDDTYVNVERLLANVPVGQDYVGCLRVADLEFNHWIPYASGSGYWLSRCAAEFVAASGLMRPGIIDDGAVGQVLDGRVAFVHDRRYVPGPIANPNWKSNQITVHKCLPATMLSVHEDLARNGRAVTT